MKTKILLLILFITLIIFGVYFYKNNEKSNVMVGNDVDQHGCKPSAGYTFSKIKNSCIRIFESGLRMNPQDPSLDKTVSAFAVFTSQFAEASDDKVVEIFLPNATGSILLSKLPDNGAGTWGNANYQLTQWKGMYTLEDNMGKVLYQGSIVN